MKTALKIGIVALVIGGLSFMVIRIIQRANEKAETRAAIEKIPSFEVQRLDGSIMRRTDLKPGTPTIFLWFSPTCDHCHGEIKDLVKNAELLTSCQTILVSEYPPDSLQSFAHAFGVDQVPHFTMVSDHKGQWYKAFEPQGTPTNFIYNNRGVLVEKRASECQASYLRKKAMQN